MNNTKPLKEISDSPTITQLKHIYNKMSSREVYQTALHIVIENRGLPKTTTTIPTHRLWPKELKEFIAIAGIPNGYFFPGYDQNGIKIE